eukprot:TRINITY_DN11828_c0_g1_i1.p1 TRINITY_DN11828_c0_g1~~TRINITY_DN11828_c0_g1_i1.p1  ORF type:complete len:456 (-),score=108.40 TRINITY_DN11828_c0_g1_i1:60-1427(-)
MSVYQTGEVTEVITSTCRSKNILLVLITGTSLEDPATCEAHELISSIEEGDLAYHLPVVHLSGDDAAVFSQHFPVYALPFIYLFNARSGQLVTASFGPAASYTKDKIVDVVNAIEPPAQVDPSVHEVIEAPVKDESEHAAEDLREPKKILTAAERHAEMQRKDKERNRALFEERKRKLLEKKKTGSGSSIPPSPSSTTPTELSAPIEAPASSPPSSSPVPSPKPQVSSGKLDTTPDKIKVSLDDQLAVERNKKHIETMKAMEKKKAAKLAEKERIAKKKAEEEAERREKELQTAKLRLRFPDGQTKKITLDRLAPLSDVVDAAIEVNPQESFIGITQPYPHRTFTTLDLDRSMEDLKLTPSEALVIVHRGKNNLKLSHTPVSTEPGQVPSEPVLPVVDNAPVSFFSRLWNMFMDFFSFLFPGQPAVERKTEENVPSSQEGNVYDNGNTTFFAADN